MSKSRKGFGFSGRLQADVMAAVWRLGEAKVDDVRSLQPQRGRPAYTTVQTVMNRLVERGLLERERRGSAFVYRACYDEAEYLSRTIQSTLVEASPEARRTALVNLVGELESGDLADLANYANRIRRARAKRSS